MSDSVLKFQTYLNLLLIPNQFTNAACKKVSLNEFKFSIYSENLISLQKSNSSQDPQVDYRYTAVQHALLTLWQLKSIDFM